MNPPLNIVLIGQHGAGKTTLAEALVTEFNLVRITTGDLLRDLSDKDPQIKADLENGRYVGDNTVNRLVGEKLKEYNRVILDGFPRTFEQAKWLYTTPSNLNFLTLLLSVSDQVARDRLIARGRKDDIGTGMESRMRSYQDGISQLLTSYSSRIKCINGEQPIPNVLHDTRVQIQNYLRFR